MDASAAARMSDPLLNPNFSRRWRDLPPVEPSPAQAPQSVEADAQQKRLDRLAGLLLAEYRRRRNQAAGGAP